MGTNTSLPGTEVKYVDGDGDVTHFYIKKKKLLKSSNGQAPEEMSSIVFRACKFSSTFYDMMDENGRALGRIPCSELLNLQKLMEAAGCSFALEHVEREEFIANTMTHKQINDDLEVRNTAMQKLGATIKGIKTLPASLAKSFSSTNLDQRKVQSHKPQKSWLSRPQKAQKVQRLQNSQETNLSNISPQSNTMAHDAATVLQKAFTKQSLLDSDSAEVRLGAFRVFDTKGCGRISVIELRYILTSLGDKKFSDKEVDDAIGLIEVDGDGLMAYHDGMLLPFLDFDF